RPYGFRCPRRPLYTRGIQDTSRRVDRAGRALVEAPARRPSCGAFCWGSYFLCRCADVFTNKKNGHAVMVTITDRGPYIKGRCIDLSKAGARALGFAELAPVSVVPVVSD